MITTTESATLRLEIAGYTVGIIKEECPYLAEKSYTVKKDFTFTLKTVHLKPLN